MIVLYWLKSNGEPSCAKFKDTEAQSAQRYADLHMRQGMGHVQLSMEPDSQETSEPVV